jgi:hypothetical protein
MSDHTTLTWFGGHAGVEWNGDRRLHLIDADAKTFCGITSGLRPTTARCTNSAACKWCETCLERAQEVAA